jgi:hypothetical protein
MTPAQPTPANAPRKGGVLMRSTPMTIRVNTTPATTRVTADPLTTKEE